MTIDQASLRKLLLDGFEFRHGHVFIGRINNRPPASTEWQVHSDDHRHLFSALYAPHELEIAVDKFCLILNQIEDRKSGKPKPATRPSKSMSTVSAL